MLPTAGVLAKHRNCVFLHSMLVFLRWKREWEMCQSYMLVVIRMSKRFCCDHIFFHREPGLNAARFWFHAVPTGFTSVALRKPHLPVHFPYNQVYSWDWSGSHFLGMFLELPFTSWGHGYSSSQGLPSILVICTRESSSQRWKCWTTKNARFPTWEKEEHETYGFIWFACGSMCLVRFIFHLPLPWSSGHFTYLEPVADGYLCWLVL